MRSSIDPNPYITPRPLPSQCTQPANINISDGRRRMERVTRMASQRAVVVFSVSTCCMCHTVTRLFRELGVDTRVVELDQEPGGAAGREMEEALAKKLGGGRGVPAVFIGSRLVGSTDKIMSLHLSGKLVPLLRNAGALWV